MRNKILYDLNQVLHDAAKNNNDNVESVADYILDNFLPRPNFGIGDFVYLKTDVMQEERIVTAVLIRENNTVSYNLACGSTDSWHYDFEIARDRDIIKVTNN